MPAGTSGRIEVNITGNVTELDAAMARAGTSAQRGASVMQAATEKISAAFDGMEHRLEHSGVMIAFAVNNMMDGSQKGVDRALHSIALLGFAFGPVVGAVTTAMALIAETIKNKLHESAKELEEFQKKIIDFVNAGNVAALMKKKEELLTGTPIDDKGNLVPPSTLVKGAFKGSLEDLDAQARKSQTAMGPFAGLLSATPELKKAREQLDAINADLDAAEAQRERLMRSGDLPKTTITVKSAKREAEDAAKLAKEKLELRLSLDRTLDHMDEEYTKSSKKYLDEQIEAAHKATRERLEHNDKANKEEQEMNDKAARALAESRAAGAKSIQKTIDDAARASQESWMRAFEGIQGAVERAFGEMERRGGNFATFMRRIGQQLLSDVVRNELKMLEAHAAIALTKQTIDADGAAKSKALSLSEALASITHDAAKSAAAVYAGTVKYLAPLLGPLAIPIAGVAAGAAFAAVEAFGAMASAAGGFDVPAGINPVTQLHAQEMVLPASLANAVRAGAGGLGGGEVHLHIHALDANDVHAWARRNTDAIGKAALTHISRGGALPSAAGRRA